MTKPEKTVIVCKETMKGSGYVLQVIGLVALFAGAMAFISVPMRQLAGNTEPLADSKSLRLLTQGKTLPIPIETKEATFHNQPIQTPALSSLKQTAKILGLSTGSLDFARDKRIEVDLTHQKVYAFEGNVRVYEFLVSTGKWGWTPTGEFTIWAKVKSQLMSGGSKALHTYYYLPNVPWVMFFYNDSTPKMKGFSFHGTYWHNNFGHPMSHGCINMKIEEAKILYDWATPVVTDEKAWSTLATPENPGTNVIIYGETPKE
ncbi:MAG TPA: L,D-transpeptidase family protein [Patescibacteria group bacterium]|nr:L,D-transpeptidase family protein [Patescibacteria group bacterium]